MDLVPLDITDITAVPFDLDMFMDDGTKERVKVKKHNEKVQLQTKLAFMIRAPLLFYENDPHWKHIENGTITLK